MTLDIGSTEFGRNFTRLRSLSWTPTKFQTELLKRKRHL